MPGTSVFQRLPLHIAEHITELYLDKSDTSDDPDTTDAKNTVALHSLYDVSYTWRTLALEYLCQDIVMTIPMMAEKYAFAFPRFPRAAERSTDFYRFVKHVILVSGDINKQPSEKQYQSFAVAWPEHTVFPFARLLTIRIDEELGCHAVEDVALENKLFDWVAQRIPTSLPKLQEAHLEQVFNGYTNSAEMFIFDDYGEPIVYPRLEWLKFSGFADTKVTFPVDKSIAPFPMLRYLKWDAYYAFEDDTLFRGNGQTLEYLDIGFDSELIALLQREKAFSGGKYPKLCCIRANSVYGDPIGLATNELLTEFTASLISPATQIFRTTIEYSYRDLMNVFTACSYTGNIQVLTLKLTTLSLLQVIELVKLLPNMTSLMCNADRLDPELIGCPIKTITDRLQARYPNPLSRCFKRWIAFRPTGVPAKSLVASAISLAILCPNFAHAKVLDRDTELLEQTMRGVIASGSYDEYFERLDRIFCYEPGGFFRTV
ncbi:hypothetical protein LPJ59_003536 [Coemansia sp. RSA 2399]|nr:hypothetical protein LPJ59_003536 [Coemansia sp. RSA 2399]